MSEERAGGARHPVDEPAEQESAEKGRRRGLPDKGFEATSG